MDGKDEGAYDVDEGYEEGDYCTVVESVGSYAPGDGCDESDCMCTCWDPANL